MSANTVPGRAPDRDRRQNNRRLDPARLTNPMALESDR
jgi:hypothetical protein